MYFKDFARFREILRDSRRFVDISLNCPVYQDILREISQNFTRFHEIMRYFAGFGVILRDFKIFGEI